MKFWTILELTGGLPQGGMFPQFENKAFTDYDTCCEAYREAVLALDEGDRDNMIFDYGIVYPGEPEPDTAECDNALHIMEWDTEG